MYSSNFLSKKDQHCLTQSLLVIAVLFCSLQANIAVGKTAPGSTPCKNKYPNDVCQRYKVRKLCNIVGKYCSRSCGICVPVRTTQPPGTTAAPKPTCSDKSTACPLFAKNGYCSAGKFYKSFCPSSCDACPDVRKNVWGSWSSYSHCSAVCGPGAQTSKRKCLTGNDCVGQSIRKRSCMIALCAKKSAWNAWTAYSQCTASCGIGYQTRYRTCNIPNTCEGAETSSRTCNTRSCQRKESWGQWGYFSVCTVTCGWGKQVRTRKCIGGKTCVGRIYSTRYCSTGPCPVHRPLWSDCTATCGGGTRFKFDSQSCTDPTKARCFRTFEECNTQRCPPVRCTHRLDTVHRYRENHACCTSSQQLRRTCGHPYAFSRIIGGQYASSRQWPWMVYLNIQGSLCGATLIDANWVLTAAHCLKDGRYSYRPWQVVVHMGHNSLSRNPFELRRQVERIILHPSYSTLKNDIALIKLATPAKLGPTVQTVCLPQGEEPPIDITCYATGWGVTGNRRNLVEASEYLIEVGLKNFDINVCRKVYSNDSNIGNFLMNNNKLLCAGSLTEPKDVCRGDSGGPLVCQRCSSCAWYLAGITSFGPKGTCGVIGVPGMYTKVKSYEDWIFSYIPSLRKSPETCSFRAKG